MDAGYQWLLDLLYILIAAVALGLVAIRLRLSPALGALAAGILVGSSGLRLVRDAGVIAGLAELGVTLLLFSVGLEFPWRRLRQFGLKTLLAGGMQLLLTLAATLAVGSALGFRLELALAVGCLLALSSTAAVLRALGDRGETESVHGRWTLSVLLVQDLALVPLLLLVNALGGQGAMDQVLGAMARSVGLAVLLVAGFYLVICRLLPRVLKLLGGLEGREMAVMLAFVLAVGSAGVAHWLGLSPAIGAFVAGMLLAESPFALQIRVDVAPLKALFLTVFFASVGMMADLAWVMAHWVWVAAAVAVVVAGKAFLAAGAVRMLGLPWLQSLAAGLCLAQLGEFSFVLGQAAVQSGLMGGELFRLVVAVMALGFFMTPGLVAGAARVQRPGIPRSRGGAPVPGAGESGTNPGGVVEVGYGPAGQTAARDAVAAGWAVTVIELNGELVAQAQRAGFRTLLGDGTREEILHHAEGAAVAVVLVTVPDFNAARGIVMQARLLAPRALVIVRSRFHRFAGQLAQAGAHAVGDEEEEVGDALARRLPHPSSPATPK